MATDRDKRQDSVTTATGFRVPYDRGISRIADETTSLSRTTLFRGGTHEVTEIIAYRGGRPLLLIIKFTKYSYL